MPRWLRIFWAVLTSVIRGRNGRRPPQRSQGSTSIAKTRRRSGPIEPGTRRRRHRIGRTGRAGLGGEALLLVTPREQGRLRLIEQFAHSSLSPRTIPTRAALLAKREERPLASLLPSLVAPIGERWKALADKLAQASGQDAHRPERGSRTGLPPRTAQPLAASATAVPA